MEEKEILKNIEENIKECDQIMKQSKSDETEAMKEIVRYFDRIHDKLFAYQLFFLAGYISLIAIPSISVSVWWLLIPIVCVARLIYIDWKMMEINRNIANICNLNKEDINNIGKEQISVNRLSLEVILESIVTTAGFVLMLI